MKLIDIFKDLTYGELQGLHIGNLIPDEQENEPDPRQYEQIISYLNLGLTELYKRFFLLSKEIYIQEYSQIATYLLHSDFALTNVDSVEDPKYIVDTDADPFVDNILKIEEVYDEEGVKLPINDVNEELSVYTPTYRSVQIPYPDDANTFSVQYRASCPPVIYTFSMDAELIDVPCPNSLREALLYFIGSRAHRGGNIEKSQAYWQMFKTSCADVKKEGLEVQVEPSNWRFDGRGWV